MLAGLIPFLTGTIYTSFGCRPLSEMASTCVQRLIGNGLYLKNGCSVCEIETNGKGLYLGTTSGKGFETIGSEFTS